MLDCGSITYFFYPQKNEGTFNIFAINNPKSAIVCNLSNWSNSQFRTNIPCYLFLFQRCFVISFLKQEYSPLYKSEQGKTLNILPCPNLHNDDDSEDSLDPVHVVGLDYSYGIARNSIRGTDALWFLKIISPPWVEGQYQTLNKTTKELLFRMF